jgi:hypothetical protein
LKTKIRGRQTWLLIACTIPERKTYGKVSKMSDYYQKGIAALQAGDKSHAIAFLSHALRDEPRNPAIWLGLAEALDDPNRKKDCLRQVLRLEPGNIEASSWLEKLEQPVEAQEENTATPILSSMPDAAAHAGELEAAPVTTEPAASGIEAETQPVTVEPEVPADGVEFEPVVPEPEVPGGEVEAELVVPKPEASAVEVQAEPAAAESEVPATEIEPVTAESKAPTTDVEAEAAPSEMKPETEPAAAQAKIPATEVKAEPEAAPQAILWAGLPGWAKGIGLLAGLIILSGVILFFYAWVSGSNSAAIFTLNTLLGDFVYTSLFLASAAVSYLALREPAVKAVLKGQNPLLEVVLLISFTYLLASTANSILHNFISIPFSIWKDTGTVIVFGAQFVNGVLMLTGLILAISFLWKHKEDE